jgi:hypothetical protein
MATATGARVLAGTVLHAARRARGGGRAPSAGGRGAQVPTRVAVSIKQVPLKVAYGIKALADGDEDKAKLVGDVFPKPGAA